MIWAESWLSYLSCGRVCPGQGPAWPAVRSWKSATAGSHWLCGPHAETDSGGAAGFPFESCATTGHGDPGTAEVSLFFFCHPSFAPSHMPVHSESFPFSLPSPRGVCHFHTLAHTPACPVDLILGGPLKSAVLFPTLHPWALPHSTPGIPSLSVTPSLS